MKLKEIVISSSIGAFVLLSQAAYSQQVKPENLNATQKQEEGTLDTRKKQLEHLFETTSWGWWRGQANYKDPGESDAYNVALFKDLAVDFGIRYSRGNLNQRKTAMKAFEILQRWDVNIDRATETICYAYLNDGDSYVRELAFNVIDDFNKEKLLRFSRDSKPEIRALLIRGLSRYYNQDKEVRDYLEEIIADRTEETKVRVAATILGTSGDQRLERYINCLKDPNEPISFRKELVLDGLGIYCWAERGDRKFNEYPIQKYKLLLDVITEVSQEEEMKKVLESYTSSTSNPMFWYLKDELIVLYFQRARSYMDKRKLKDAKNDLYQGIVLMSAMPPSRMEIMMHVANMYGGWKSTAKTNYKKTKSMLKELIKKETDPNILRTLRYGVAHIEYRLEAGER